MRWLAVTTTLATALVASVACGGKARSDRLGPTPSSAAGTASTTFGSGGLGNGTTGATGSAGTDFTAAGADLGAAGGNVGGSPAGGSGNAGAGQAGQQGCVESNGTCSCPWLAPTCEAGKNLYVGQTCPPTLDDARLVANWPLGGPSTLGYLPRTGQYGECDDGSRSFTFRQCGEFEEFAFDAHGRIIAWSENLQSCVSGVCGTAVPSRGSCAYCDTSADPPGEGKSCFPRGPFDGPAILCMVDAEGHWLMPALCN